VRSMRRIRAGLLGLSLLSLAVGCGARTGMVVDDSELQTTAFAGAGNPRSAGGGMSGGGSGEASRSGAGNGGSAGSPPVISTNCQLLGDDPRVAGIRPDQPAKLDAADFVVGDVKSYHWSVQMEDCDAVVQDAQFKLQGVDSRVVTFQPSRPAFYHFTLEVTGVAGDRSSCKLEVPVAGVGMRVELCWDTSTSTDLDLYLHTPYNREPWFTPGSANVIAGLNETTCNGVNCSAMLRTATRVNWGYEDSPSSACNTPAFESFLDIGRCPNPRSADDNNQTIASGTTERIQLDNPKDGQNFRVMVQNFFTMPAHPHVFVYCSGERAGSFDAPPTPPRFVASNQNIYGVMWRAADITTHVNASGTVLCDATRVMDRAISIDDSTF